MSVHMHAYARAHASRGSCKPGTLIIIIIYPVHALRKASTFVTCTETAMALYYIEFMEE